MIYTPNASAFMLETRRLLFMESCWNYVNYVCHSRMNNVDGEAARGKEFAKDFRCREFSIVREFRSIFRASCEDFSCRLTPSSASSSSIFTLPVSTPRVPGASRLHVDKYSFKSPTISFALTIHRGGKRFPNFD